jgi:transposase
MIFPIATRAQAITMKNCGCSLDEIEKQTGIGRTKLRYIIREAKKRGYDPEKSLMLKDEYFSDGSRTGRPSKLSEEQIQTLIAASKTKQGEPRKTNAQLAKEFGVSGSTISRFKEGEYKKPVYQPQRKDLPDTISQARASAGEEAEAEAQPQSQAQSQANAD